VNVFKKKERKSRAWLSPAGEEKKKEGGEGGRREHRPEGVSPEGREKGEREGYRNP